MYNEFRQDAEFLTVYIREAHPTDHGPVPINVKENVCYPQPHNLADRIAIANDFSKRFQYPIPLAIDSMANTAEQIYAAFPERLYIIDPSGKIVYKGGPGPMQYHPEEARGWLEQHFPETARTAKKP